MSHQLPRLLNLTPGPAQDWPTTIVIAKFDAWARRGASLVWSDRAVKHYDQWLSRSGGVTNVDQESLTGGRKARMSGSAVEVPPRLLSAQAAALYLGVPYTSVCARKSSGSITRRLLRRPPGAEPRCQTVFGEGQLQEIQHLADDGRRDGRGATDGAASGGPTETARRAGCTWVAPSRYKNLLLPFPKLRLAVSVLVDLPLADSDDAV